MLFSVFPIHILSDPPHIVNVTFEMRKIQSTEYKNLKNRYASPSKIVTSDAQRCS
jgi:hypothetical protein